MNNKVVLDILIFSILVLFISYKLCGILPEIPGGKRERFCKHPVLYVVVFSITVVFLYLKDKLYKK